MLLPNALTQLTVLASPECRLNGEYLVTGGGRLRRASVVEWGTVLLPNGPGLSPGQRYALLAESGRGEPREYQVAADAFNDLMLMLATFGYAMRTRVHAVMDTIWPLGFVPMTNMLAGTPASGCSRSTRRGPRGRRTPITFGAPVASSPVRRAERMAPGPANRI